MEEIFNPQYITEVMPWDVQPENGSVTQLIPIVGGIVSVIEYNVWFSAN